MRRRIVLFALLLMLQLAARDAMAHDFWLEPEGNVAVLRYGHRGGKALPIDAAKVDSVVCLDARGHSREVLSKAVRSPTRLVLPVHCAALVATFDAGTWCLTPDGEKPLPKRRCKQALRSWRSKQFAKWIDVHSPSAPTPLGTRFEIVPTVDLSHVRQGDKATFHVLLDGKPAVGAVVAIHHKPLGQTDSHGRVRVRVRDADIECISASLRHPLADPDADEEVLEASLTFAVAR